jgi:hypothetical protein
MQEIEYNFGRFFHQLSMHPPFVLVSPLRSFSGPDLGSFAVKHYLRVLELVGEWQHEHPEVTLDGWKWLVGAKSFLGRRIWARSGL